MTDTLPEPPDLDPAGLAGSNFSRTRRGFEPTEVHAALGRAADALRAWKLRDTHQAARVAELEDRLADAQRLDETRLTEVLGEETARIVAAARDAANEIRAHAEEAAAQLLQETRDEATSAAEALKGEAEALRDEAARVRDEAVAEATRVRTEAEASAAALQQDATARHDELIAQAESVLAERTAEADAAAAEIREAAAAQLETARAETRQLRDEAAQEAAAILEAAREEGRGMVAEAKAVRERILRDLVERRGAARQKIEGARAGRDRIIEVLRSTIDEVASTIDGLSQVEEVAGEAAASAASTIVVDTESEVAELLVELGGDPTELHRPADEPSEPEAAPTASDAEPASEPDVVAEAPTEPAAAEGVESTEAAPPLPEPAVTAESPEAEAESATSDDSAVAEGDAVAEDDAAAELEDADAGEEHDDDEHDDEDGPGATVHDLFARIRAEGLDDEGAEGDEAQAERGEVADARPQEVAAVGDHGIDLTASTPGGEGAAVAHLPHNGNGNGNGAAEEAEQGAVATLDSPTQLLDRRDALLAPVEKSLSRVLRRLASDEQNELLDQLRRIKRGRPDAATLLPADQAAVVERFVDALAPDFGKAADAGSTFWADLAGTSAGALFGDDDLLRGRLAERVTGFLDLHRAHLERTFADAESEGLDVGELSDRVRAAYRDWRSGSLADLAGDLATAGFAHGERRAAGPGTPWRWVVDNGGLPCADGEDNALAGAVPCEEPFPTGDVTPPAHPGCRCILAPAHQ